MNVVMSFSRGGSPENTLLGIKTTHEAGYHSVEVDVRVTADGHAVLLHDITVDRTSDSTGTLANYTLSQLDKIHVGDEEKFDITMCFVN